MKRENGYYWVKPKKVDWVIAEWDSLREYWTSSKWSSIRDDSDFEEIDERKIERL